MEAIGNMMKHLTPSEIDQLLNFQGYGNPQGPIWFIGFEEYGHAKSIPVRLQFQSIEDTEHARVCAGKKEHTLGEAESPTWDKACEIVLRLMDHDHSPKAIRDYKANHLGRTSDKTFLTDVFPLPQPGVNKWDYGSLFPQFSGRTAYEASVIDQRICMLQELLDRHQPKIVICYSLHAKRAFKRLFKGIKWHRKQPFRYGELKEVHVFRSPAFSHGYMGKKQVKKLCRLVEKQVGSEALAHLLQSKQG